MHARSLATALLVSVAPFAFAQGTARVSVEGRVLDASAGRAIAGAELVVARDGDTVRTTTDDDGRWRALLHASRTYRGRARSLGFRAAEFDVSVGSTATQLPAIALAQLAVALDRMVVTAARREQRLADVVVTTEVVSSEDIERTGASDLGSALSAAAGIQLEGGVPAGTGVMLQGLGSQRVLILLDGQPMPGRIGGEFDVSRIPTSVIDRVEVVKGPQSSLYGTDAMGGVINVITRGAVMEGRFGSASIVAGSRNRRDVSAAGGGSIGAVALRGEAGHRYMETAPGRADENGALAERIDAAANAKWTDGDRTTIDLNVLGLDERQRWLGGTLYNFADNLQITSRLGAERTLGAAGTSRLRASLYGSVYDHLSRASVESQPIRGDTGQRQVQRLFQGELAYTRELQRGTRAHTLDAGLTLRHDDTRSVRIPGGRRGLLTVEPSAQMETELTSGLTLATGARVSHSTRWGTHVTPRVALRYRPLDALILRASAGSGFRAPDFRELYMRFQNQSVGYAVYGNENLRPEESRNVTAGAEWTNDVGYVRAQLFHNEFRGFIETRLISDPSAAPVYEYANVDDGFTRGVEVEGAISLARLRLDGGYSLLEARDRGTDQVLLGRPTHSARATLSLPLVLRTRSSVTGLYTGRTPMQRDTDGTTVWRDGYPRLDVRLARPLAHDVDVTVNVENIFDRRPALWAGYTGRQVSVSASWKTGQ